MKSQQQVQLHRRCAVCAGPLPDRVHGHYGGANVCLSCAAFFRRSVCKGKTYRCGRARKCVLFFKNSVRNACRSCRMEKCYEVGMLDKLVPSSRIRKMRQKMAQNSQLLDILLKTEEKFSRVFNAVIDFPEKIGDQIYAMNSFGELISAAKKWDLLGAMAEEKPLERRLCLEDLDDMNLGERFLRRSSDKPWKVPDLTRHVVLFVELAKTMPVFGQLEERDQLLLLSYVCVPVTRFCYHYYCAQHHDELVTLPDDMPNFQYFVKKYGHDPRVKKMAEQNVLNCVKPFKDLALTKQEMVTLRAVMLSHTIPTGLSVHAQHLLHAEAECTSQFLLQQLQQRMGMLPGARAYAEALQLIQRSFRAAQAQYELVLYLELFHEDPVKVPAPKILEQVGTLEG